MKIERIALLDTDFISKAFRSRAEEEHLIDHILSLPGYKFFCHHQIVTELGRHFSDSVEWLRGKVEDGSITCYTDEDLLNQLQKVYGDSCYVFYMNFLNKACAVYTKDYYSTHYKDLGALDPAQIDKKEFLIALENGDQSVGEDHDLGEIKTAVLLQVLSNLHGEQIYIFCSDDRNARNGITRFPGISCLSILSIFWWLKNECDLPKDKAKVYFDSYITTLAESQTTFKVVESGSMDRFKKIVVTEVFEEIYDDRFLLLRNGMLKYVE